MRESKFFKRLSNTAGLCASFALCLVALTPFPSAHAQTFATLYSFTGGTDGSDPSGQLLLDASGNLFGPTSLGGDLSCNSVGCGVIFELSAAGSQTVLHTFTGKDGIQPSGTLASDSANNLYGTTTLGGNMNLNCIPQGKTIGCGVVFKLNKVTGKYTILHTFENGADGGSPNGVVRDSAGNLYGTTYLGGDAGCGNSQTCGTIYEVSATGKHTVLYSFTGGTDGGTPISVIRDNAGNLYGMTLVGGDLSCQAGAANGSGCGVVFEFTAGGTLKVLHAFTGGKDGQNDAANAATSAGLIQTSAGALFGTSPLGGLQDCKPYQGCGLVFKMSLAGKETVLHSFDGGAHGLQPTASLTSDSVGNLYGTTTLGGYVGGACYPAGCGTAFKLNPNSGELTTLYSFTDGADGFYPSYLTSDAAGNLYGVAEGGGDFGTAGTIYEITQ
jgi:uncharacterized repeat protein (TIGR03803 family)